MYTAKNCGGLDRFRMAAALLVITIHTSPLAGINESVDFFLTRILARTAVPFFFMVTGQFVVSRFLDPAAGDAAALKKFLAKSASLYLFCILLYLPIGIYAGHYQSLTPGTVLRMLFFDGSFYHLWYFPACILGVLLVFLMSRFMGLGAITAVSSLLYLIGLAGDSYYGLAAKIPALEKAYDFMFGIASYTRNGIFLAPIFLVLGARAGLKAAEAKKRADRQDMLPDCMGLVFSFFIMAGEAFVLRSFEYQRHDSMYLMLVPTMFFLYQCLLSLNKSSLKAFRTASAWIYILHPAFIVVVRAAAKPLQLTPLLVENNLVHFLAVTLLSLIASGLITYIQTKIRFDFQYVHKDRERKIGEICDILDMEEQNAETLQENSEPEDLIEFEESENDQNAGNPCETEEDAEPEAPENIRTCASPCRPDAIGCSDDIRIAAGLNRPGTSPRAWIELDSAALEHNVAFLRSRLPEHCRLMPAVKAEAYGHGGVIISRLLSELGVDAFCVACISEGISLREAGIQGEILILGYTSPQDFPLLYRYQLIQSVVDHQYARLLNRFGRPLHVHVAVDTGMHRLGIRCENTDELLEVCGMKNLIIDGFFTHLSVSDSLLHQDILFTDSQVQAFYQVIDILKAQGCPCHGLHLLASYGILNFLPGQEWDGNTAAAKSASHPSGSGHDGSGHGLQNTAELAADYVRPGIVLYGVLGNKADSSAWRRFLKPVLSLKATVASVRPLYAGEAAGYGAAFTAKRDMRIAAITIGYADGLPRELSYGKGIVLINGCRAPIIGRICMDQTLVDVSRIPRLQAGDTAVIIGRSGKLEITADSLASQCGTITNEILSRLGARLDRIL